MQSISRGCILIDLVLHCLLVQNVLVDHDALILVWRQVWRNEEVDVVLYQQLTGVAFWVLEIDVQSQLVAQTDVLRVDRLAAVLERVGQIERHGKAMRLVEKGVGVLNAIGDGARRVGWHVAFGHSNLHVLLMAYAPTGVVCKQLARFYQLHLDGRYLDALSEGD